MDQNELTSTHQTGELKIDTTQKTLSAKHKEALLLLGYMFFQHHQRDKALVWFEALDVLFPKDRHIKLSLAYAHLINGHYARALELVDHGGSDTEITIIGRISPEVFIKIRALWALNRPKEARQQFQACLNKQRRFL